MAEIFEFPDEIVVTLEVPAAVQEVISINVEGDLLVVDSAEEPIFHTEIALPCAVEAGRMQADYERGVLSITLPRAR